MTILLANTDEYSIAFDEADTMLMIRLRGYWTMQSLDRYNVGIARALNHIVGRYCRRGEQLVIIDVSEFQVQSPTVLEGLTAAAIDKATAGRRTALVLSSALLTMQARRAAPHYTMFADVESARAWLLA